MACRTLLILRSPTNSSICSWVMRSTILRLSRINSAIIFATFNPMSPCKHWLTDVYAKGMASFRRAIVQATCCGLVVELQPITVQQIHNRNRSKRVWAYDHLAYSTVCTMQCLRRLQLLQYCTAFVSLIIRFIHEIMTICKYLVLQLAPPTN